MSAAPAFGRPAAAELPASDLLASLQGLPMAYGAETFGRIYLAGDKVYRVVEPGGEPVLRHVVARDLLGPLAAAGLVQTEVRHLSNPPDPAPSILEHRRVPFVTLPPEWGPSMLLAAARLLCRLNLALAPHGLMLKDGHALNVTFDQGRPTFLDFGSLTFAHERAQRTWFEEFRGRVFLPLWVATFARPEFAWHMLRTEPRGLMWYLAKTRPGWHLPPVVRRLRRLRLRQGWQACLQALLDLLDRLHFPSAPPSPLHERPPEEQHRAANALLQRLGDRPPASLHVLEAGLGSLGETLAAAFGAPVCATDPAVSVVEHSWRRPRPTGLPLDLGVLDVLYPTPPYGAGGSHPGAVQRLGADCVVALDAILHLPARQGCTMDTFAQIVSDYSSRLAVVDFVHPDDARLTALLDGEAPAAPDYSLDAFLQAFRGRFSTCEPVNFEHPSRSLYVFAR